MTEPPAPAASSETVHPDVFALGMRRFQMRLARLVRLVDVNAPPNVLANDLVLLEEALLLIDPVAVGQAIAHFRGLAARRRAGYCSTPSCNGHLYDDQDYCAICMHQASEDLSADAHNDEGSS